MKKIFLSVLTAVLFTGCVAQHQDASDKVVGSYYDTDAARYHQNVVVKEQNDAFIVYEYKDIRIDELAPLAIDYCASQNGRDAFLREIILYRNNLRRATFDCSHLATEE